MSQQQRYSITDHMKVLNKHISEYHFVDLTDMTIQEAQKQCQENLFCIECRGNCEENSHNPSLGRFSNLVVTKEGYNCKNYNLYLCSKCSDSINIDFIFFIFEFKNFVRGFLNSSYTDDA